MTTRSTTQRVAARLLAGSRARWATSANTTSSATSTAAVARRIAAPMPSRPHNRSCVHAPPNQREATISTSPPRGGGRGLLRGHYREIDATSRASAARSTWSAPKLWITLATEFPVCGCAT